MACYGYDSRSGVWLFCMGQLLSIFLQKQPTWNYGSLRMPEGQRFWPPDLTAIGSRGPTSLFREHGYLGAGQLKYFLKFSTRTLGIHGPFWLVRIFFSNGLGKKHQLVTLFNKWAKDFQTWKVARHSCQVTYQPGKSAIVSFLGWLKLSDPFLKVVGDLQLGEKTSHLSITWIMRFLLWTKTVSKG